MVVTSAPSRPPIGTAQERMACPFTCTVQAPHWAIPQPYFVPVSPTSSRKTQSSGVSLSTSSRCEVPLTLMVTMILSRCAGLLPSGSTAPDLAALPNHQPILEVRAGLGRGPGGQSRRAQNIGDLDAAAIHPGQHVKMRQNSCHKPRDLSPAYDQPPQEVEETFAAGSLGR